MVRSYLRPNQEKTETSRGQEMVKVKLRLKKTSHGQELAKVTLIIRKDKLWSGTSHG